MNRNLIFAAIPFAIFSDAAFMVKALTGYSDPTLTVVSIACFVITILLVLRALGWLRLPSFSWPTSQAPEVHNHYHTHYDSPDEDEDEEDCPGCEDCEDEDCPCDYTAEDLAEAREQGRKEGYEDGYDVGHEQGYDAGYAEREAEEDASEAQELAKAIINALHLDGAEVVLKPSPLTTVDTPAENTSSVAAAPAPTAQA